MAIFDKDLKARTYKNFSVTEDGQKIQVKSGGKANFNPQFDNESFIELPKRAFLRPWKTNWNRVYFASNGADKCVNFKTEKVPGPDPTLVSKAAGTTLVQNLSKEKETTSVITWVQLGLLIIILLKVLGIIA